MFADRWRGSVAVRLAFWAAATFAFVMAVLPHPPRVPGEPSDKVQHVIAFAVLAGLGHGAFPRLRAPLLLLYLSAFGAAIEIVQAIPALHRDSDLLDWLADTLAAGLVLLLLRLPSRPRTPISRGNARQRERDDQL